jgi:hypothetical protein
MSPPPAARPLSLLMTLEHQDIEAIAHRVVELLQGDDAAIGGSC